MSSVPRKDSYEVPDSGKNDPLVAEIEALCHKGMPTAADLQAIRKKYPDNDATVAKIIKTCLKKNRKIHKIAEKVAMKIKTKYELRGKPMHEIYERMLKYKKDNKWSDLQYSLFMKELSRLLSGLPSNKNAEMHHGDILAFSRSRIASTLGKPEFKQGKLEIKDSEQGILNEILSLHDANALEYNTNMMLNLTHTDCSIVSMSGAFNRQKHNPANHIHPVIAALFLPKFELLEYHMLYADIGRIIKCFHEGSQIMTEPDYLLYMDLISDPNDVVCDHNSAIADLRNRYKVQLKLRTTVKNLRQGLYYEDAPVSEFMTALNQCRNNLYDSGEIAYQQDEGSILRRLMSVFSLRPVTFATTPLTGMTSYFGASYMNGNIGMYNQQPISTFVAVPFVTVQLPPKDSTDALVAKDLKSCLDQTLWLNNGKNNMIPCQKTFHDSKELLIFYVNRRIQHVNAKTKLNPFCFNKLPLTMNTFSKVNNTPLDIESAIELQNEVYQLRSVVAVTDTSIKNADGGVQYYVTGCIALLASKSDFTGGRYGTEHYRYDPMGAAIPVYYTNPANPTSGDDMTGFRYNKPISRIDSASVVEIDENTNTNEMGFYDLAQRYGTIYVFAKDSGYTGRGE